MTNRKLADDVVIDIVEAKCINNTYKIHLWFSDGTEQNLDFEPFLRKSLHPEIKKYLDKDLFKGFSIVYGQLNWNDYDLCFSIQDLYDGTI